jgi:hypothetical protein
MTRPSLFAILAMMLLASPALAAVPCESLSTLKLSNTTITLAQSVNAGQFTAPGGRGGGARGGGNAFANLPAFCRVATTLRPTTDSEINIEVWMPASGWNTKLLAVGNGAWAGSISYNAMAPALAAGYATTSTDTGHPDSILASRSVNGVVEKTRPLCPYPQTAQYKGSGDTNDAANFACR